MPGRRDAHQSGPGEELDMKKSNGVSLRLPPKPRAAVLVVAHPDGHLEAFAEAHVSVLIARVPIAPTREAEALADDVFWLSLPLSFRALYRADRLRAVGTTRPLLPSTMTQSRATEKLIVQLNAVAEKWGQQCA